MPNAAELTVIKALLWQLSVPSATAGIKPHHVGEI